MKKYLTITMLLFLGVNGWAQVDVITMDSLGNIKHSGEGDFGKMPVQIDTSKLYKWADVSKAKKGELQWQWSSDYVSSVKTMNYYKHKTDSIWHRRFEVYDSLKGRVAYQEDDSPLIITDSFATIKVLIQSFKDYGEQYNNLQKRFNAATHILDYLQTDGSITNKKKFDLAVKEYQKLMKRKR